MSYIFTLHRYSTAMELKSLPIWGTRDWYGGGGYVVHLRPNTETVLRHLKFLQENHWIDTHTRAVLLEFATYNSQVSYLKCMLKFSIHKSEKNYCHTETLMLCHFSYTDQFIWALSRHRRVCSWRWYSSNLQVLIPLASIY